MNGKDEARARLLGLFQAEAREHLDTLTRNLLMLERGLPADQAAGVLEETYRATHTLKGRPARWAGRTSRRSAGLCEFSRCSLWPEEGSRPGWTS